MVWHKIKLSSEWERYKLYKEPFSLSLHQNYQMNNVTNLKKQVSIVSLQNATHKATLLSNWWNWSKYFKEFHISLQCTKLKLPHVHSLQFVVVVVVVVVEIIGQK